MNNNINFIIKDRKTGSIINQYINVSCYGNYLKHTLVNDYKNHMLELFISDDVMSRGSGGVTVTKPDYHTFQAKAPIDLTFEYLSLFKDRLFKYNFELIEDTIGNVYSIFYNQAPLQGKGSDTLTSYIKVTMDLSQFAKSNEMKNALFFIRNGVYTSNTTSLKTMRALLPIVPKIDPFLLLQIGENVHVMKSGSQGEYTFFSRGYSSFNQKGDNWELKSLKPLSWDDYWDMFKKSSNYSSDDVVKSRYEIFKIPEKEMLGLQSFINILWDWLIVKNYTLGEREIKLIKSKVAYIAAGFSNNNKKFEQFKELVNG